MQTFSSSPFPNAQGQCYPKFGSVIRCNARCVLQSARHALRAKGKRSVGRFENRIIWSLQVFGTRALDFGTRSLQRRRQESERLQIETFRFSDHKFWMSLCTHWGGRLQIAILQSDIRDAFWEATHLEVRTSDVALTICRHVCRHVCRRVCRHVCRHHLSARLLARL